MANETRRKIVVEIEGQSKNFDKIVSDIQTKMSAIGKTPSTAMQKQLQQYTVEMKSLQATFQRLLGQDAVIDTDAVKTLQKQMSSITVLVERITKSFSQVTLPENLSTQLNDLIDKLNIAKRSLRGLQGALGRNIKRLTESGDLTEAEKTGIYKKTAKVPVTSEGKDITTYGELAAKATALSKVETSKLTEENRHLLEVYKQVNEALKERLALVNSWIAEGQAKIAEKEKEIAALDAQTGELVDTDVSDQERKIVEQAIESNNQRIETNENVTKSVSQLTDEVDKHTVVENKNQKTITKSIGNFIKYQVVIRTLRRVLQSTISTITTMDEAMTGMAVVTSMNRQEAWQLLSTWQDLASQTGKTTSEIASMATKFYQQGRSTNEVIKLTEAAAKAATIAGIDGSRSIDLLTNAINGFQLSANQAMEVSDKFAALAASAATDYEELAIALSKVAAQANLAGMSMDFTLGLLTKGIETTKEAPETIGTALKTVISRMRELSDYGKTLEDNVDVNRVARALGYIGIELMDQEGQFRDLEDVLTEVGQKWETLTVNQQASIAVAMAGTRQQSRFIAMMQDFDRTLELADTSASSYGATLAQSAKYMDGLQAKITLLKNAWESLVTSETVTNILITGVEALTGAINFLSDNLLNIVIPAFSAWLAISISKVAWTTKEIIAQDLLNKENLEGTILEGKSTTNVIASTIARIANWIAIEKQSKALTGHTFTLQENGQWLDNNTGKILTNTQAQAMQSKGFSKLTTSTIYATIAIAAITAGIMLWRKAVKDAHVTANDAAQEGIETLEKMQVEYYNLRQSAEKVESLAESFDTLSRKINKSTEDLQELQSIAQQINDDAGKQIVDTTASIEAQRKQILAYKATITAQQKASKTAMAANIGTGYSNALRANQKAQTGHMWSSVGAGAALGVGAVALAGMLTLPVSWPALLIAAGVGVAAGAIGGGITSSGVSEDDVKQAYIDQLKSTATGKETLKQAFVGNSEKIQSFNTKLQELMVGAAINAVSAKDLDEKGLNVSSILKDIGITKLSEEQIAAFEKALDSSKLADYQAALETLGTKGFEKLKDNLKNTGTLFDIFSDTATKDISNIVTEFDNLGFSLEEIQMLLEGLGSDEIKNLKTYLETAKKLAQDAGKEWDKLSNTMKQTFLVQAMQSGFKDNKDKLRNQLSTYKKTAGGLFGKKFSFGEGKEAQQAELASGELQRLIEAAYKESGDDMKNAKVGILIDKLKEWGITQWTVDGETYYAADLYKSINKDNELITSLLQVSETYIGNIGDLQAKIDEADSAEKNLLTSRITSTQDLIQDVTKLENSMEKFSKIAKGGMSLSEKMELASQYPDLASSIMTGELDVDKIKDYYQKEYERIKTNIEDNIDILKIKKDAGTITTDEEQELKNSEVYLEYLNKTAAGAFIDLGTEAIKVVTDEWTKANTEISKYEKALDRLDETSQEYADTQKKLLALYKNQIGLTQTGIDEIQEKINQKIIAAGFNPKDFGLVEGQFTYSGIAPEDTTDLQILLGLLNNEFADSLQEQFDYQYELAEKMAEMEVGITKKALEEKKEAYEKYFDQIDAARDDQEFETDRQSLLQQMSALSGGFDTASKSRLKDLKKQLRELEQQQLEKQQEEERNALLKSLDSELETLDETIKKLINQILKTSGGTNQYSIDSFTTPVDSSLAANQATVATQANGTSTKIKLTDVGSSASGLTIGTFNVTFSDVGDNFDAEQAGYDLAAALQKAIEQKGVNVNARK